MRDKVEPQDSCYATSLGVILTAGYKVVENLKSI